MGESPTSGPDGCEPGDLSREPSKSPTGFGRSETPGATARRSCSAASARRSTRSYGVWNLTPAERKIALLLLKGYGHKEIATLLGRSERTIRQHAVAVYRKSNLSGRAELAAFFLEDLLLPSEPE